MDPKKMGTAAIRNLLTILTVVFFLLPPACGEDLSPIVITAPEVKQMMEGNGALLVHVLSRIEYEFQHIPDSINIPINEMEASNRLPVDKERPLIFYCMGLR